MASGSESLDRWRSRTDAVDRELVRLLNQRARLVLVVGRHKARKGLPIRHPQREAEILITCAPPQRWTV